MALLGNKFEKSGHIRAGLLVTSAAALMTAGCTQSTNQGGILPSQQNIAPATSLQPAPLTPVQKTQLEPIKRTPTAPTPEEVPTAIPAEPKDEGIKTAALAEKNAQPVTRQALIGAWTVSNGGANCQLFLALTSWSGGYRAAPRGCGSTGIAKVAAWDVKGKQVVLVDTSGSQVATLYRAGETQYNGSASNGSALSLTR